MNINLTKFKKINNLPKKGEKIVVIIGTDDAGGLAHADAVLLVPKN